MLSLRKGIRFGDINVDVHFPARGCIPWCPLHGSGAGCERDTKTPFGGVEGGTVKNTDAIRFAISAADQGGGRIVIPSGCGGNPCRDGRFKYYVREGQRINDPKGLGPFLLAAIQLEQMERTQ